MPSFPGCCEPRHEGMAGPLSAPGCHLGWAGVAICRGPPVFLLSWHWVASIGQASPFKRCPSWSLEVENARVHPPWPHHVRSRKTNYMAFYPCFFPFGDWAEKKKKFVYIRGLSKPQRILAVNIFLNQITKMYWLPGYSVKCRWPWKSQGHILPFLENKHHKSTPSIYEEGKETPSKASRNTSQK